jgi:hypothetical protein
MRAHKRRQNLMKLSEDEVFILNIVINKLRCMGNSLGMTGGDPRQSTQGIDPVIVHVYLHTILLDLQRLHFILLQLSGTGTTLVAIGTIDSI